MVACKRFGYGSGKALFKNPPKRFKGTKATAMSEPLEPEFVQNDYPDCRVKRTHRGDLEIDCFVPERGYSEKWNWNGNHTIDYEDGSHAEGTTGTQHEKFKHGRNKTTQESEQNAVYNHRRDITGNLTSQKELPIRGGGYYHECGGHEVHLGLTETHGTLMASGRAHYHIGKCTTNAEGGIGLGVNKGSDMKIWQRMEPDGTWHLQVKPSGEEGGNAVIKITPDGAIHITTKSTITVESKGTHTIKAPLLKIEAPVKIKGTIESSGDSTAPNFHGCADKARGSCHGD